MLTLFLNVELSVTNIRWGDVGNVEYDARCSYSPSPCVLAAHLETAATVEPERNARNDALRNEAI